MTFDTSLHCRGSRGATVVAQGLELPCAFSVVCLIKHGNSWNLLDPHLLVPAVRERERSYRPSASFMLRERKRGVCERGREGGRERAGESEREASERERTITWASNLFQRARWH
jgi:hypothetical protein